MPDDNKCSKCPRQFGDGDMFVLLELVEQRSDPGPAGFMDPESKLKLCLVCYEDRWRLNGMSSAPSPDDEFYSTKRDGVAYKHQACVPASS